MTFELIVHRPDAVMFKRGVFEVEVDGVNVGRLRSGGQFATELKEGEHRVRVLVGKASSNTVSVLAGGTGTPSLVVEPATLNPFTRTEGTGHVSSFALALTEGQAVSRVGPTFWQLLASRPPSLGSPARTPKLRALWRLGLALGATGFVLLPLVRNGIGAYFLFAAVLIFVPIQAAYVRARRRR